MAIKLQFMGAKQLSETDLPPKTALLRMADDPSLLASMKSGSPLCSLELYFNDASDSYGLVRSPDREDAQKILDFFDKASDCGAEWFIAACQSGVGRSQAVVAALAKKLGRDNSSIRRNGTFNPKLYKLLMAEIGQPVVEPLVSIVVRVKYRIDRLRAFMLSMKRQRWHNWEVIAVTDGRTDDFPFDFAYDQGDSLGDERLKWIETPEPKGRWGHPYRQLGIDAARGEYISLQNDDNIACPGWIDQMITAMQIEQADLCACCVLHSYSGWSVTGPGSDICSWMARAELVRRHPWNGITADYEWHYLKELEADGKLVNILRPLITHN